MQLNNVAIDDVVQCQVSEYALAVGKVIQITPHRVYVEFTHPVVPYQLKDCGYRPRCIWYFGEGCQSKLSLIQPYNPPIYNMCRTLSDEENERIVRTVNEYRRKESQE